MDSKIPDIGQTLISTKIGLENNPEKLRNKSRPNSLTCEENESRRIGKGDHTKPQLLVHIETITTIGFGCVSKSRCDWLG